jgi:hypothetical protein
MGKQIPLALNDALQPMPSPPSMSSKVLIFPSGPSLQREVDAP